MKCLVTGAAGFVGSHLAERLLRERHEVIGVGPRGFTGTEPGVVTDIFLPAMMNKDAIESPG